MNSNPEYHVAPSSNDRPPPSRGHVVRFILLCLGTIGVGYIDVFVIALIHEIITRQGFSAALQGSGRNIETPFVLALVPLGIICLSTVWLDRHIILKPTMTSSHVTIIAYRILTGWVIFMMMLLVYAMLSAY